MYRKALFGAYDSNDDSDDDTLAFRASILRNLDDLAYQRFPQVTLRTLDETGQAESVIPVLKQRSYTGRKPVISSPLANTRCVDLGVEGVLKELNVTLGTSYTLDDPVLRSVIQSFIPENYDFGMAYAHLRPYWYDSSAMSRVHELGNQDQMMRQNMLANNRIPGGNIPPRRVWDLYANRVVPFCVALEFPWAISHAWMATEERRNVRTPINGYEWPVPMPKDVDFNHIRIEMLNLGAEYVWLDVLCLRQEGGLREDLRKEEWKVDVPTIGSIYRDAKVVYYFSGLGRPFHLKPGDLESDRCWFRRAWTLQEVSDDYIIGGETGNYLMDDDLRTRFHEQLHSLQNMEGKSVFYILRQMQNRVSTKPLDKVAGLAYLLSPKSIPMYDETQIEEDTWGALVDVMPKQYLMDLLFLYPEPGNGRKCWRPSWNQVMARTLPSYSGRIWSEGDIRTGEPDMEWYEGMRIDSCNVHGLAEGSNKGKPRQGELVIKDSIGASHIFKILANHVYPIPDCAYTLISSKWAFPTTSEHWVVGRQRQDGKFEKVSVIYMDDRKERRRLYELHVVERGVKTLLC